MLHLKLNDIYNISSNESTVNKGKKYYNEGKVNTINFNKRTYGFKAIVIGKYKYDVEIKFNKNGHLDYGNCECTAYYQHGGYCKHIVAALFKIYEMNNKNQFIDLKEEYITQDVLDFFTYKESYSKVLLNFEVDYEFIHGKHGFLNDTYLSLKVGDQRLYVVKNIKEFIEAIINEETLSFGKNFTFDPNTHYFKEEDKLIIDLLKEIYDTEKALDEISFSFNNTSLFKGKKVYLPQSIIKKFFEIVNLIPFNANINDVKYNNMKIVNQDLNINFLLTKEKSDLKLEIDTLNNMIALVKDREYIFFNDRIHKISEYQMKNIKPFYDMLGTKDKNIIKIPKKYNERFISHVYPTIKKIGSVKVNEMVEDSIYNPGLKSKIYLNKIEEGISANIKFVYGDITIDPFKIENENNRKDDRIILRDIEKETEILSHFEDLEFKVSNKYIYLDDDDKIFDFIYNKMYLIKDIAQVYYSEDFKTIKINEASSFSGGVKLKTENNLLELKFEIEGITKSELNNVFNLIKEKKKYYKLKNGSFLPLDTDEFNNLGRLVEYLDLKDLGKEDINIPKFKALYIDEYLKESNMKSIKRNLQFKELVQNIREPEDIEYDIPENMNNILREYQKIGFKWLKTLYRYGFGGILADDMGLGKTIQVLTFLLSEKIENGSSPSLIIAPTSLVYNWLSEIEKFTPNLKTVIISGSKEERKKLINNIDEYDLVITSYPLVRRDIDLYKDLFFRFCILDEAQYIKNPSSQNAKSVKEIQAQSYFALTGTPIENSLIELWSIFDFIMPGLLLSHTKFTKIFERPIVKGQDNKALKELRRYIKPFILRRLKKEVLNELPDKIESKIISQLTDEQKKIYLAYLNKIKGEIEEEINTNGIGKSHIKILSGITRLRQICAHPSMFIENYEGDSGKLLLLEELVKENIYSGHRILIFSQFTSMLNIIKNMLDENSIEYKYLYGSTNMKERGSLVKKFNEGEGKVFLISLKAGGTGLNLTGADTVIHFDPWWNPAVEDQASDRAYRIGQKKSVHVMKLITKDTIEEKIYELQEKKKKLIDSIIKPGETIISKLTEEEIKYIFDLN